MKSTNLEISSRTLLKPESAPATKPVTDSKNGDKEVSPEDTANFASVMTYWWMNPLLQKVCPICYRQDLRFPLPFLITSDFLMASGVVFIVWLPDG